MVKRTRTVGEWDALCVSAAAAAWLLLPACTGSVPANGGGSSQDYDDIGGVSQTLRACKDQTMGATGLRRISRDEFAYTLSDVLQLGDGVLTSNMLYPEAGGVEGFLNVAEAMPLSAEVFGSWAQVLAAALPQSPVVAATNCADWTTCMIEVQAVARKALSRDASPEFLAQSEALFASLTAANVSPKDALTEVLRLFFMSPDFVFREMSSEPRLAAVDVLRRLSFLVWSAPPDEALLASATDSVMQNTDNLRPLVKRMLADPRGKRFTRVFIDEWLRYSRVGDIEAIALNPKYPALTESVRKKMLQETQMFLDAMIGSNKPISELLAARYSYMDTELANYYGAAVNGTGFQEVRSDMHPSAGLLSQASIIVGISGTKSTSPSRRGYWIMKNILCETPPPFPDTLDPTLLQELEAKEGQSTRERLAVHASAPQRSGCHIKMDNIGLSLESFNSDGHFRTADEFGNAIDASGHIDGVGTFTNHQELATLLTAGEQFKTCLVKKMMTFAIGRALADHDQCVVQQIAKKVAPTATFEDVLTEAVISSSFALQAEVSQ